MEPYFSMERFLWDERGTSEGLTKGPLRLSRKVRSWCRRRSTFWVAPCLASKASFSRSTWSEIENFLHWSSALGDGCKIPEFSRVGAVQQVGVLAGYNWTAHRSEMAISPKGKLVIDEPNHLFGGHVVDRGFSNLAWSYLHVERRLLSGSIPPNPNHSPRCFWKAAQMRGRRMRRNLTMLSWWAAANDATVCKRLRLQWPEDLMWISEAILFPALLVNFSRKWSSVAIHPYTAHGKQ